jgi:hypothetical protein
MTIDQNLVPRRSERLAARTIEGKAVLVVLDAHALHTLNEVGTRVFDLVDGTRDVQAITDEIVREFEVEPAIALQDVRRFLLELSNAGALALGDAA